MRTRPQTVTIAAVVIAVFSLANLISPLLPSEGVPEFVIYLGVALGIAGLVAAAGLWTLRSWSIFLLAIVVSALNLLSAAPGIAFAPNAALQVAATITVVGSAIHRTGSASGVAASFDSFLSFRGGVLPAALE